MMSELEEVIPLLDDRTIVVAGMVAAYYEKCQREILSSWVVARAALVSIILRRPKGRGKRRAVSTRNRTTRGTHKRKVFPSDSHLRGVNGYERKKGERARYRDRYLGTFKKTGGKAKGLPKLGDLGAHRVGRPEVPRSWRVWKRKVARATQLEKQRTDTYGRRTALGRKPYPFPRKSKVPAKGWSDLRGQKPSSMTEKRAEVRLINLAHLRHVAEAKRRAWEAAH